MRILPSIPAFAAALLLAIAGMFVAPTARLFADENPAAQALVWDAVEKRYEAKIGETSHEFAFVVTNRSSQPVEISQVNVSCACTAAPKPENPWLLAPGANSTLKATIDFAGKTGGVMKMIEVISTSGSQILSLVVVIPEDANRTLNQKIALGDRQAVFRDNCARCHSARITPQMNAGEELFSAACSICHEANPRATMVPDLAAITQARDEAYWRKWVTDGGENTLMPAFAQKQGGPLDCAQIEALVAYLRARFPDSEKTDTPAQAR